MIDTMEKRLNLGCGQEKKAGYVNLDFSSLVHPDVVHDLNVLPYPFLDDQFDLIEAFHVLEHLDKPFLVMKELHRILKPGGVLHVKVPHFSRGFTHAEHAHGFDVSFPLYFNKQFTRSGYFGVDFELMKMELHWAVMFHLYAYIRLNPIVVGFLRIINQCISFLANIQPFFCSRIWCYWVGGFEEIDFKFRCVKNIRV